jgi:CubicO group peptidase (beta-lactamase class C family)
MRIVVRLVKWLFGLLAVAIIGLATWLFVAPPELIRVGASYSAKIVCSNVFIAGRDPHEVLGDDVQAPGHPLLRLMRISVDTEAKRITAGLFGLFGTEQAVARDGLGCTVLPDGRVAEPVGPLPTPVSWPAPPADALWPQGSATEPSINPEIAKILDNEALTGPGMRAVVVVRNGRIEGERYADGFSAETPLLGWSMTKTVNTALLGTAIEAGRLSLDGKNLFDLWKADERAGIAIRDLTSMSSSLAFNEGYGDVSDVTRMLYLEPDMSAFSAAKSLEAEIGTVFNYSSGSAVLLSRLWQDAIGDAKAAVDWPNRTLFRPLGMASAVMETDASGTFVGSSYLYATARDWARFGLFLMQDGTWEGVRILPPGFVAWMREPAPASNGVYGKGQLWLKGPDGPKPEADFGLPADIFWAVGHDGQTMAIIPSKRLVVLRLGLTPRKLGYQPQAMVAALAKAVDLVTD